MFLRLGICMVLFTQWVKAQELDSLMLNPVMVYGLPEEKYLVGSTVREIDSTFQAQYLSSTLGEMLSFQLPVYFRNYGSGMLSSISLRGTAPHHTAVLWNGLSINSFSLGQADFSILPSVAFSEIKVHEGGGSARFGSGAIGGSVLLKTSTAGKPLTFIQEIGSFGQHFTGVKNSVDLGRLSFSTTGYRVTCTNNFPVPGKDYRMTHAAFHQEGVVEDITYAWSSSQEINLHYWYNQSDKEIQQSGDDEQQDRNHRLLLDYKKHSEWGIIKAAVGLIDDVIVFNGSKSEVFRWNGSVDYQHEFSTGWNVEAGGNINHIIGKIKNYKGGEAIENRGDVFVSLQREFNERLSFALNIRQPFVEGFSSPILPYIGGEYALMRGGRNEIHLQSNVSKNFRVPTLNDRYWGDAGDLDLQPETSYAAEVGGSWKRTDFEFKTTLFTQQVDQWIQWVPGVNGVYRPRNVKEVRTRGVELSVHKNIKFNNDLSIHGQLAYQVVEAITLQAPPSEQYAVGKQLIYTPRQTGSGFFSLVWKKWQSSLSLQYSGKRYTESSNAEDYALAPFILTDFSISRNVEARRHRMDLRFSIKNIFNKEYILYSGKAQPGRNFNVQLIYQLNSKK